MCVGGEKRKLRRNGLDEFHYCFRLFLFCHLPFVTVVLSTNLSFNTFLSCTREREFFFLIFLIIFCRFIATSVYSLRFVVSCMRKFVGFYYFLFSLLVINLIDRNYHWGALILFFSEFLFFF